MSGRPMPNRADIARAAALLQPKLIADRLFADDSFLSEFGIDSGHAISFGGGPPILKKELYAVVRALFSEQRPQVLKAVTGDRLTLSVVAGTIAIAREPANGDPAPAHVLNPMLHSSDLQIRIAALDRIAAEIGPTGPDPDKWRPRLEEAPLTDDEMDEFWCETDASVVPHMSRVARDFMTGTLDRTHLAPRSLDYWSALCGAPSPTMDQETWLKEVFGPHRRRLIERDLVRGLDLCLAMYLRDDLTLRPCTAYLSHDELWAALQQLQPLHDPFSLLGEQSLGRGRADGDERFGGLASSTVERLCADQLQRGDGLDTYAFLPALVDFVLAELRVLPHVAAQPAYWRRLCAWTQAGLLVRAFQQLAFDAAQLSEIIEAFEPDEARIAELLDLRQAPLSHPSETSRTCIHAEVLGRLLALQQRDGGQGKTLPGAEAFAKALEKMAEEAPMLVHMPGPLELDRLPFIQAEQQPKQFRANLDERASELTPVMDDSNWLRFAHLSRAVRFESDILTRMTDLVATAELGTSEAELRTGLGHLAAVGYIAVAQRHAPLADAILARCVQSGGLATSDKHGYALITLGLIASAAFADANVASERLSRYLTDLAFVLPRGAPCRQLAAEIAIIRTFTAPAGWSRLSRAEALASLGA
jgi:hypothetical protein